LLGCGLFYYIKKPHPLCGAVQISI